MTFKKSLWAVLAIFLMFNLVSCGDDDDDETYMTFAGDLDFTLPKFVKAGDELSLIPDGLKVYDDETTYGYYWKVSPTQETLDTTKTEADPRSVTGEFSYEIPDTLCTLSISLTVFGTGYYTTTVTHTSTILDAEKSITGQDSSLSDGVFTDPRDGRQYPYSSIGDRDWFCKNLSFDGCGTAYENCDVTIDVFGKFYNWEEAVNACPEGWRLPTEEDWIALASAYDASGNYSELGTFEGIAGHLISEAILNGEEDSFWEYWPKVKKTDDDGLNILPLGYCIMDGDYCTFDGFSDYAILWTGTSYSEDQAVYRYIFDSKPDVFASAASRTSFAASVRCVRDIPAAEQ